MSCSFLLTLANISMEKKKLTNVQRYIKETKERRKSNTSKAKAATRTLFILHKKECNGWTCVDF